MNKNVRIDLGHVDYNALKTDADYDQLADKLLPDALIKLGEATAKAAWEDLQKGFKGSGLEMNSSSSDKRKFIRDGGKEFQRTVTAKHKRDAKSAIIEQLREQKDAKS